MKFDVVELCSRCGSSLVCGCPSFDGLRVRAERFFVGVFARQGSVGSALPLVVLDECADWPSAEKLARLWNRLERDSIESFEGSRPRV